MNGTSQTRNVTIARDEDQWVLFLNNDLDLKYVYKTEDHHFRMLLSGIVADWVFRGHAPERALRIDNEKKPSTAIPPEPPKETSG